MENIKIRWKGSLVLLIVFTAFVVNFHVSNIHYFSTSPQTIKEDFLDSLYIWLFFLLNVLIFAFALNFSNKKILKNEFKGGWLLKFNIIMWISLTLFFEIINFALPCSGEGCFGKFIYSFYIPLVLLGSVVIFSVIPSLIFYKIYDNKRAQRTLIYVGIIISAFFFILALLNGSSCNFNTSHSCLAEKALEKNDPSTCEKQRGTEKDYCYLTLSEKYAGTKNFCDEIKIDEFLFNDCISNIARNTKNAELCNQIKSTVNGWGKDECLNLIKQ